MKIDAVLSTPEKINSGVPQGGIISPLLYIIYVADLQKWLKFVTAITYADDTSTSVSHKLLTEVKRMLEEDALNVLKFMASNGLVANPAKTALLFLNNKNTNSTITIDIGSSKVMQVQNAKLLGIMIDDNQKWSSQLSGLISSLNSRLFIIKRLSNTIAKDRLKRVADSLYLSKIRYGIQLCGKVLFK